VACDVDRTSLEQGWVELQRSKQQIVLRVNKKLGGKVRDSGNFVVLLGVY
jgi:hypothetical protein